MIIKDRYGNRVTAGDIDRMRNDSTFTAILDSVRSDQIQIFVQSGASDTEKRENAHSIIRALDKIEQALQSVVTEEAIKTKREKGHSK